MDFETIWKTAVDALHSGEGISRKQLDGYIRAATKGQVDSFADFARERARHQNIAAEQEQNKILTPGPLATAGMGIANGMALGIPGYQASRSSDPADQEVGDFMARGAEANPKTDFLSNMAGGVVPAAVSAGATLPATSALVDAAPVLRGLPSLFRTGLAGGLATTPAAGMQAATAGGSPADIATAMGESAILGTGLSIPATWAAAKFNPTEHLLGRAIQEATPGKPGFAAGKQAIVNGETTPYRIGRPEAEMSSTPVSEAEAAKLPEVLRPMNFEKAPSLRSLAAKRLTESPEAATQAENAITKRMARLVTEKENIAEAPETGYNALLEGRPVQSPEAVAAYQKTTGKAEAPTARQLFNLQKSLDKKVNAAWKAKAKGGAFDFDVIEQQTETADLLRQTLQQEVPGFSDLQQAVQPYFRRQAELQGQLRSIIGRTIKPLGRTAEMPAGGMEEGLKESVGSGPSQIREASARELVAPLTSTNSEDMFGLVKGNILGHSLFKFKAGATTGAVGGAASSKTKYGKKVRGLFSWPVAEAQ